jgi:hypothetical protein
MLANRVVTATLLAVVLTACGGSSSNTDSVHPSTGQPSSADPAELVGQ